MSGGSFDYEQYHINNIANFLESYIYGEELDPDDVEERIEYGFYDKDEEEYMRKNNHTVPNRYEFSEETIKEFKKGLSYLKKAAIYAQRIDWLLSGDDGEETFHNRLKEDLDDLNK